MIAIRRLAILCFYLAMIGGLTAQKAPPSNEAEFDKAYADRIKKEELFGVYIPNDLTDAFTELERLTDTEALVKFKSAGEETIRTKLHFSLGKWIITQWGFYGGSRFSHYLKELGLLHPDDMARFVIVSFHRHLNDRELGIEDQVLKFRSARDKELESRKKRQELIKEETRIRKNH